MKYRKIGNNNIKISAIGIGALHFGIYCDLKTTKNIIHKSIDYGINFIDTAPLYGNGNSQKFVGESIKLKRDKIFLATKIGLKKKLNKDGNFGVDVITLNEKNIKLNLEESLKIIGTDYIDLLQLHAFDHKTDINETLFALKKLKTEGKILEIGCSNYNENELKIAIKASKKIGINIASCQMHYNIIERRASKIIIPLCNKNNISVISYRALARGLLTGKYKINSKLPEYSRATNSLRLKKLLDKNTLIMVEKLDKYAKKHNMNVAQLSIAWQINKKNPNIVLLGVRNINQLNLNLQSINWKFNKKIYKEIDEIIIKHDNYSNINSKPYVFFEK